MRQQKTQKKKRETGRRVPVARVWRRPERSRALGASGARVAPTRERVPSPFLKKVGSMRQAAISHFMLDVGRSPKCLHLVQARIRHLGLSPTQKKKRETGIEPATPTLARWCSTAEPLAHLSAPLTLITIHHLRTCVKRLSKVFRFVLIFCIVYTDLQI